jgi:hypothetical protein
MEGWVYFIVPILCKINIKKWERKRKTLTKNEEISGGKAHTNTQKLI